MQISELSLSSALALIQQRQVSPVELVSAFLERIQALNPLINAFITITPELALRQAREIEYRLAHPGDPLPPLAGALLALKDLFETQGIRTTAGSKFFADHVPERDAAAVEALYHAGGLLLGKLNMHEIALGVTNVNPHFGACRNPWMPERISGGSSGGSAAALAASLCLGSLGSDTGGSIRIPAALCGIVGLKPTYGRVSLRGVIPLSWNLDHAGPIARNVQDVALLLQVIAGYDPLDPASIDLPVPDYIGNIHAGVKGWKVALASDEFFTKVTHPQVTQAVERAAQVFEDLGAQVHSVEFPGARQAALANGLMTTSDAAAFHRQRLAEHPQDFGADVLQRLKGGAAFTSTEYILARRTQSELRRSFERFFDNFEVLLTPTTPVTAPPIEGPDAVEQARLLTRFTAPFNLTGLPALSLPCGFDEQGLPIGLQIIARPWAEAPLLQAAYAYEQACDWHTRRPALD